MSTRPTSPTGPTPTTAHRPFHLGRASRRVALVTHIVAAGVWLGLDVAMALLVARALTATDAATSAFSLQALELVTLWPMFTAAVVCALSGAVLGLGSRWGLLRYWWVAVKLALNIVLATLVLVLLGPGVTELAAQGRLLAAGQDVVPDLSTIVFPPVVSTSALLFATVISVVKPWGRLRAPG